MSNDSAPEIPPDYWTIPRPNWDEWKPIKRTQLWKAVALLCDLDPKRLGLTPDTLNPFSDRTAPAKFTNVLTLARNNLGKDSLRTVSLNTERLEESEIDLSTFATWAHSVDLPFPPEFHWQPAMTLPITGWPWGTHETELLRKLALAADHFWKDYDPKNSAPPKQWDVVDWLLEHGVPSKNMAEAIATILRADGLPTRSKRK